MALLSITSQSRVWQRHLIADPQMSGWLAPGEAQAVFYRPRYSRVTELCMPPLVVWALGAVGAFVVAKWLAREAKRIGAAVNPHDRAATDRGKEDVRPLEQDPVTGIYHPK
jgi:hypothetical protein